MPISILLTGFVTGLGLIVVIGAQNAYVLRVGISSPQKVIAWTVTACVISDAALIAAGILGVGALTVTAPWVLSTVRLAGVAFLITYSCLSLTRAIRPSRGLTVGRDSGPSLTTALTTVAALTWLNPHVYLDTVVLLGSIGATFHHDRWWFASGAMLASTLWFSLLGFGARALRPLFARGWTWRVLDAAIALMMLLLALALMTGSP